MDTTDVERIISAFNLRFDRLEVYLKGVQAPRRGKQAPQERPKTEMYHAVLDYLEKTPGWVRPGAISSAYGGAPQSIGMILKRMVREGIAEVQELPPNDNGWSAKEYRLKGATDDA